MTSRRTRGLLALASALALVAVSAAFPGSSSAAVVPAVSLPPTGAGIDISFPQCLRTSHVDFPANIPFAVIGVNGGSANNSNPCFSSEYNSAFLLAGTTDQPHAAVYVNTGNPALAGAWWPSSDRTQAGTRVVNPNGSCENLAGAACAYVYGYSMAEADYRRVGKSLVGMPELWWLDVETSNTWQSDLVANAASLSGMVDYFKSKRRDVGRYSTSYQWNKIAGATPATSDLAGLPSWLAGGSYFGAPADCEKSPLTPNGRVAMVQYVMYLDNDYSCRLFGATPATISPGDQSVVGSELTAVSGRWGPGDVSYSYQWNRDGLAIPGATTKTYVPTTLDAGTQVTVTITGLESGYSAASNTSSGVAVLAALMPESVGPSR
jgi:hypothetical protein